MKESEYVLEQLELELAQATNDADKLKTQLAMANHLESVDYQRSCTVFEQGIANAVTQRNRQVEAQCHEGMARMLWKMSDNPKAHKHYQLALEIYMEVGDLYGMAKSYSGLGIISSISEEHNAAIEYFEKALSASRRGGHDSFTAVLTGNIGNVYFEMGRYKDAMECFEHALNYCEEYGNELLEAQMLTGMAGVHVYQGEYDKGLVLLYRSLELDLRLERTAGVASCMLNVGLALRKQGKYEQALKQQFKTLKHVQELGYKDVEYRAHLELSLIYQELDEPEKSAHHLTLHMEGEQEQKKWVVKKQNEKLERFRTRTSANGEA